MFVFPPARKTTSCRTDTIGDVCLPAANGPTPHGDVTNMFVFERPCRACRPPAQPNAAAWRTNIFARRQTLLSENEHICHSSTCLSLVFDARASDAFPIRQFEAGLNTVTRPLPLQQAHGSPRPPWQGVVSFITYRPFPRIIEARSLLI